MKMNKLTLIMVLFVSTIVGLTSCQKENLPSLSKDIPLVEDWNIILTKDPSLKLYIPFENSTIDSVSKKTPDAVGIQYVDGINGKAYQGGSGSNIIIYDSMQRLADVSSFTISLWIKTSRNAGDPEAVFGTFPGTSWLNSGDVMFFENWDWPPAQYRLAKFGFNDGSRWVEFMPGSPDRWLPIGGNTWKHLAIARNSSVVQIYVDGVKAVENSCPPEFKFSPALTKFILGAKAADKSWAFKGTLDQFRLYSRVLSSDEIQQIYNLKI